MTRRALFRLDAGRSMGLGHALRCLALADELVRRGWSCRFAMNPGAAALVRAIRPLAHDVIEADELQDPSRLVALIDGEVDLLVVDSYRLDAAFESAARDFARRILVIDDLAERPHDADLLMDATYGLSADRYAALAPSARILSGPAYALLPPAFARARAAALQRRRQMQDPAERILVTLGGAPPAVLLERLIRAARQGAPHATIDVAAGASDIAGGADPQVRIHRGQVDVAALTAAADIAIGAGGSSSWERCCLGLPTVLVEIADNQRATIAALSDAGAAVAAGRLSPTAEARQESASSPSFRGRQGGGQDADASLVQLIAEISSDSARLAAMSASAARLCDGLGARRLANEADALFEASAPRVTLRAASEADGEIMLAWQGAPGVRRYAKNPNIPEPAEHFAWLARRLADPRAGPFEIVEADGAPAGVLRFDRIAGESYRVSILVAPEWQGRGVAGKALAAGGALMADAELVAEVLEANEPSRRLFAAAGYAQTAPEEFRRAT